MDRWLGFGLLAALMVGSTGCLHHNTRGGGNTCSTGSCGGGDCSTGDCYSGDCGGCESCQGGTSGILAKARCKRANRRACGCSTCGSGLLGRMGGMVGIQCKGGCGGGGACNGSCGNGSCGGIGCVAGGLGWQQGGLDYSSHLTPGLLGHNAAAQLNSRPFTPGPPAGQTAYPYYTTRGPRDFLMSDPPSIGR